jgi:hypothetical protein
MMAGRTIGLSVGCFLDGGNAFIELRDRLLREGIPHASGP